MAKVLSSDSLRLLTQFSRQSSVDICARIKQLNLSSAQISVRFNHNLGYFSPSAVSLPSIIGVQMKQHCKFCSSPSNNKLLSFNNRLLPHDKSASSQILTLLQPQRQALHTSPMACGLEEFFEDEKNLGERKVKAGREWTVGELRLKDNVTLHKLWYVLLKERNMLMTMEEEAERKNVLMPTPERLDRVVESMQNLKQVIRERDEALNELKTGQKELHPGKWQYTPFGYKRFVRPKEYLIPQYVNRYAATKRKNYGKYMLPLIRQWMEQSLMQRRKAVKQKKRKLEKLKKKFPDSDYWKEE